MVLVLLIAVLTLMAGSAAAGTPDDGVDGVQYIEGDWVVTGAESYTDEFIVLTGNLSVEGTGVLDLVNVTVSLNCTTTGEFGIDVADNGSLSVADGDGDPATTEDRSTFGSQGSNYWFTFGEFSTVDMTGTDITDCGFGARHLTRGVYVGTADARFSWTVFEDNNVGLLPDGEIAGIENCTFEGNSIGLLINGMSAAGNLLDNCTFSNQTSYDIYLSEGASVRSKRSVFDTDMLKIDKGSAVTVLEHVNITVGTGPGAGERTWVAAYDGDGRLEASGETSHEGELRWIYIATGMFTDDGYHRIGDHAFLSFRNGSTGQLQGRNSTWLNGTRNGSGAHEVDISLQAPDTDWVVWNGERNVTWPRTYDNVTILAEAGLAVEDWGHLVLDNVTLLMNWSGAGPVDISIGSGATLEIKGSRIDGFSRSGSYGILLDDMIFFPTLAVSDSTIMNAGLALDIRDALGFGMSNVTIGASATGALVQDAPNAGAFEDCTFLSNGVGAEIEAGGVLSDCSFVSNMVGLRSDSGMLAWNITFESNHIGMKLDSNVTVQQCEFINSSIGILASKPVVDCVIESSVFDDDRISIDLQAGAENLTIFGSDFTGQVAGLASTGPFNRSTVVGNTFSDLTRAIYLTDHQGDLEIVNNVILNVQRALSILGEEGARSGGVRLKGNGINDTSYGMYLSYASNVTVETTTISNATIGAYLWHSNMTAIDNSTFEDSEVQDMLLYFSNMTLINVTWDADPGVFSSTLDDMNLLKVRVLAPNMTALNGSGVRIAAKGGQGEPFYESILLNGSDPDTNGNGYIPWIRAPYRRWSPNGKEDTALVITAAHGAWLENRSINLSSSRTEVLIKDLVIQGSESWTDMIVNLSTDLYIPSGTRLTLENTTLDMQRPGEDHLRIWVEGELILERSVVTGDPGYDVYTVGGGLLDMNGSTIDGCGRSDGGSRGIYFENGNGSIIGSRITNGSKGILVGAGAWNNEVVVKNTTFEGLDSGIEAYDDIEILGCDLNGISTRAIHVELDGASVTDCTIDNTSYGISLHGEGATITGNTIESGVNVGIFINGLPTEIRDNVIAAKSNGVWASGAWGLVIRDNFFVDCGVGILVEGGGNTTVRKNDFDGCTVAVEIAGSGQGDLVRENTVSDAVVGIRIDDADGRTVRGEISYCTISASSIGLEMEEVLNFTIDNNAITMNGSGTGIEVTDSLSNELTENNVWNAVNGMRLEGSSDNDIHWNNISSEPDGFGIMFEDLEINRFGENNKINGEVFHYFTKLEGQGSLVRAGYSILASNMTNLGQIVVLKMEDLTLKDCTLTSGSSGIYVHDSENIVMEEITAEFNDIGVVVTDSREIDVLDSYLNDNGVGLDIRSTDEISLIDCILSDNDVGLYAEDVSLFTMNGTLMERVAIGIDLSNADDVEVIDTEISSHGIPSSDHAVDLYFCSDIVMSGLEISGYNGISAVQTGLYVEHADLGSTNSELEAQDGSEAVLYNVTYSLSKIAVTNSIIEEREWLSVRTLDGTDPLDGVDVRIVQQGSDVYATAGYGGTDDLTNAKGRIDPVWLVVLQMKDAGTNYPKIKVDVRRSGYGFGPMPVEVNLSGQTYLEIFTSRVNSLAKVAGDEQKANVGDTLPVPLTVRVVDNYAIPLFGVMVDFEVVEGGGLLSSTSALTDLNGTCSVDLTLGTALGSNIVEASIGGLTVRFYSNASLQTFNFFTVSGSGQFALTETAFADLFVVSLRNEYDLPVVNETVRFELGPGASSSFDEDGVKGTKNNVTDDQGLAMIVLYAGDVRENGTITASVFNLSANFTYNVVRMTPVFNVQDGKLAATRPILFDPEGTEGSVETFMFDFGDNTRSNWTLTGREWHTYAKPGTYTVTLFTRHHSGLTANTSTNITINKAPREKVERTKSFNGWLIIEILILLIFLIIFYAISRSFIPVQVVETDDERKKRQRRQGRTGGPVRRAPGTKAAPKGKGPGQTPMAPVKRPRTPKQEARRLYKLATSYAMKEDFTRAVTFYKRALAKDPKLIDAWYNLGVLQCENGNYKEAYHSFEKVLAIRPDHLDARRWRDLCDLHIR